MISPPVRTIAWLMNGHRSVETVSVLASLALRRHVAPSAVRNLLEQMEGLGWLVNEAVISQYKRIEHEIEKHSSYNHTWLKLYQMPCSAFKDCETELEGKARAATAVLVPHVSHPRAYEQVDLAVRLLCNEDPPDVLVIIGPNHVTPHLHGAVLGTKPFQTPLGVVRPNIDIIFKLRNTPPFIINDVIHQHDHAIAIVAPFIAKYLSPDTTVVPLLVSAGHVAAWRRFVVEVARHLRAALRGFRWKLLISGDLLHYDRVVADNWSRSYNWNLRWMGRTLVRDPSNAEFLDRKLLHFLETGQIHRFCWLGYLRDDCAPLPVLLGWSLTSATSATVVDYRQHGNIAGGNPGVTTAVVMLE